jgi:hypothetical protein
VFTFKELMDIADGTSAAAFSGSPIKG